MPMDSIYYLFFISLFKIYFMSHKQRQQLIDDLLFEIENREVVNYNSIPFQLVTFLFHTFA